MEARAPSDTESIVPDRAASPRPAGVPVDDPEPLAPLPTRIANFFAIVLPFAALLGAIIYFWGWGMSPSHLVMLVAGYLLTGAGITVGYHRLFTHRSFECPALVRAALGIMGSMAVEGPILAWAATHRRHHQHSDRDDDPHSPNTHGEGVLAVLKGLYHAHFGWLLVIRKPDEARYVPDLHADRLVRAISRLFPLWAALGLLLPALLGFALTRTWGGAVLGLVWGGLVRIFFVHHVTWSVNSVCHLWGSRPFNSHDHSRNNAVFGVLALGEGWHNNHHAFPASARHGLRWWEFDLSYEIIRAMGWIGLARNIRVPSRDRIQARLRA